MSLGDLNNSNLQQYLQQYLPFSSLSDSEFNALNNIMSRELDLDTDLYNILPNPDKSDENDSDHMLTNICSNYYSAEKINKALDTAGSKVFSFFHSNIRSLPKNIDLLNDMIYSVSHKPDILAITETRLNDNTVANVDIHGYTFYHTDSPTKAGGAAIYVRNNLKTMARPDINFSMQLVESCWVEIESSNFGHNVNKNIIIGCIYRHPKANIEKYTDELDELLKHLNQRKYQVVLLGDVNIDFLKYNSHQPTERYLDMLYENNFIPVITKPTRITDHTKTLIDHIYTNTPIDQVVSGIGLFDISDHLPVFCILRMSIKREYYKRFYRDYKHFSQDEYLHDLMHTNWNNKLNNLNDSLNQVTKDVIDTIRELTDKHAPIKEVPRSKTKQFSKPWITNGILKSIKTKQKMYRSHFFSNDIEKVTIYKKYSNKLNKIKSTSKVNYYNAQFEKCKNNLKATWKLIGTLIKRRSKGQLYPTRLIRNNQTFTNRCEIVNQFNQHFTNVGPNLASSLEISNENPTRYISNSPSSSFIMSPVIETQVLDLFLALDINKSSINIPNAMIKMAAPIIAPVFTVIYNESINTGIVPDILKISRVAPIYKSGIETDPNNYRPISTLSPFAKVLERLVYNQLQLFLQKYKILYDYQFGFRKGYSTEQAILELSDSLKTAIDNREITCGLFLDFSKAFDTVNHEILLSKLYKYGIRGTPLEWFKDYLTNRQQYVRIGNIDSEKLNITCGVPQGSTLGPVLFLLYINDMPNCAKKLSFRIFADDTNVFYSGKSIDDVENVMNEELERIFHYCAVNKLSINLKKTNFMVITSQKKKIRNIRIRNFEQKDYIKYLGIYIDKHLTWDYQIKYVNSKLAKNIGIINKLRYYVDLKTLKQLYYSLIYPYINYGLMSWGNTYTSKLTKLRSSQNKCIRSIFFARKKENITPYYNLLGILKLDNVFQLKIATFVYKILAETNDVATVFASSIKVVSAQHSHNTRFASRQNLSRPKARTNYGIQTFKFISSQIWESINPEIKRSNSMSIFKKRYTQFLIMSQTHPF